MKNENDPYIRVTISFFFKKRGFKSLIYYLLVIMLPLKCCLGHSYEHALYTDFFSVKISQNGAKMSHLCSMVTGQKKSK